MHYINCNLQHPISGNRLLSIGAEDFLRSLRENSHAELHPKIDRVLISLAHVPPLPPSLPLLGEEELLMDEDAQMEVRASQFLHPHEEAMQTFRKQAKLLREVEDAVDIRMYALSYPLFIYLKQSRSIHIFNYSLYS